MDVVLPAPPRRCTTCGGTGQGQTVCRGDGAPQPEPCGTCQGTGTLS